MINIISAASLATKTIVYAALDKFDTLNNIANRVTGGRVNRDSMAKSIYKHALEFGVDTAISMASSSNEDSALHQFKNNTGVFAHARNAFFSNNTETTKKGINSLATEILIGPDEAKTKTYTRKAKEAMASFPASIAEKFASNYVGDNAAEKLITTIAKRYGWDSIKLAISDSIGIKFIGKFAGNLVTSILDRAVVNNPEYDVTDNAEYTFAADIIDRALSKKHNYVQSLREYSPTFMILHNAYTDPKGAFLNGLDHLHEKLGFQFELNSSAMVLKKCNTDFASATTIDINTTPQSLVAGLIKWISILGTNDEQSIDEILNPMLDELRPAQREKLQDLINAMSKARLTPFLERSNVMFSSSPFTNKITSVESDSHRFAEINKELMDKTSLILGNVDKKSSDWAGYKISTNFKNQISDINLKVTSANTGISGNLMDMSTTTSGLIGNYLWGTQNTDQPSLAQLTTLRNIYDHCRQDLQLMETVTHYLDPSKAISALGKTMLEQLGNTDNPGIITMGDKKIELINSQQPEVHFEVSNDNSNFVRISIDVSYKIKSYGTQDNMTKPIGNNNSIVQASATIIIRPGSDGSEPVVDITPMANLASVFNTLKFDSLTGDLKKAS